MTVKSQDDLTQPETHSTEVLLSTLEELERTKKQLEIAIEALSMIDRRKLYMCNCLKGCPLKKYYEKDNGCATCVTNACHKAINKIKELEK